MQHNEELPDPFARHAADHPALAGAPGISPDIYRNLFDSFFESDIFERWLRRENSWQLHCVGAPGCGKTTFAALTIERIRAHYSASIGCTTHMSSIFIRDVAIENELLFVEDCLRHIYDQLSPMSVVAGLVSTTCYHRYATARDKGRRISVRIQRIAHALQQRLREISQNGHAFLIVDNLDRCSPSLIELVERELSNLQDLGLGIMMTLRLPKHDKIEDAWCDFHERGPYDCPLQFFWRCLGCETHYMCEDETCFNLERICSQCDKETSWAQPDHMNMPLEGMWEGYLQEFITWDLEREHGDLGLESIADKPPLSSFGSAFRKMDLEQRFSWIQSILDYVKGSVIQTKLALDRIHAAPSHEAVDLTPEQLPQNTKSLFKTAIRAIEEQPAGQRRLAMSSIAAVGKKVKTDSGLPLNILADLVRDRPGIETTSRTRPRSVEDILAATRGYLRLEAPVEGQKHYHVVPVDMFFWMFISGDYSDEIVMANALLRTSHIPRSLTRGPFETDEDLMEKPEPSREDMLRELKQFKSPQLPSSPIVRPEAPRRGSSGLKRSKTLISFEPSARPIPPAGLGLIL